MLKFRFGLMTCSHFLMALIASSEILPFDLPLRKCVSLKTFDLTPQPQFDFMFNFVSCHCNFVHTICFDGELGQVCLCLYPLESFTIAFFVSFFINYFFCSFFSSMFSTLIFGKLFFDCRVSIISEVYDYSIFSQKPISVVFGTLRIVRNQKLCVNFINVLRAAFVHVDPKSVKRY